MASKIPKGKTPSLIGSSNGRPKSVTVERKCKCRRCDGELLAGTTCFDIPKTGGAFSSMRRFCGACYKKVLEQTEKDLADLKNQIQL